MLKQMRQKEFSKKIIWVTTIIIIISFGFLGTAYLITTGFGIHSAGKIFGRNISMMDYENAFKGVRTQAIMRYGDNFTQIQQFLDFDTETWDRLILLHEAKRRNIKVTNDEVVKEIESYPFFQRNGHFDTLLYNDILRYVFKVTPNDFEEATRENLKFRKLQEAETNSITISDEEALAEYEKQNAKVKVSYVLVNPEQLVSQAPFDETKAHEYFEANKSAFLKAPSVSVDYIKFPIPQATVETPPAPTEGTEATVTETPPAEDLASPVFQQAQEAYNKMTDGDLDKLAKDLGMPVENTGYFSANEPNLTLGWSFDTLGKLFEANPGFTDGPIETPEAFYIIKLKDKKDAYVPTYEEAAVQVREAVLKTAAQDLAKQKAQEQLTAIKTELATTSEFGDVIKKLGLEMFETPAFTRGQYLPKVGISKEFQDVAFALNTTNRLSDPVETAAGIAILYLDENLPADKEQFEKDKAALKESLLANKKGEAFSEYLTRLRLEAKLKDNIARLRQQQAAGQQTQ